MKLSSSTDSQVYTPKADGSRTTLHCLWGRAKTRLFQVLEENGFRVERALAKSETESDDLQQARIVRNWTDTKEDDDQERGSGNIQRESWKRQTLDYYYIINVNTWPRSRLSSFRLAANS